LKKAIKIKIINIGIANTTQAAFDQVLDTELNTTKAKPIPKATKNNCITDKDIGHKLNVIPANIHFLILFGNTTFI